MPREANLVNYLWPLGMVVLAPLILRGMRLHWVPVGFSETGRLAF